MAKSWSGFLPQNQAVKEQWRVLEASQAEVTHILEVIECDDDDDDDSEFEEEDAASQAEAVAKMPW